MKRQIIITLSLLFFFCVNSLHSQFGVIGQETKISIITCSPGSEIYSMYGHTAIRIQGSVDSTPIDWIYNYGTFEFTDDFGIKFARGKLNYTLSKEKFHDFQYSYLIDERAVSEQVLLISEAQKQELFNALEVNYLPENRTYLYDFFYNNCSTKVRDIMKDICGDALIYSDISDGETTFRDRIHQYDGTFEWTCFGIDLALGLPCDKIMEDEEVMFLPDFIMENFDKALLNEKPFVSDSDELLLSQEQDLEKSVFTPVFTMWLIFILIVILTIPAFLKNKIPFIANFTIYPIFGLLGVAILLLWVATDHTTTANNMNLLWASPLNLFIPFLSKKGKIRRIYLQVYSVILLLMLIGFNWLPQDINSACIPLILGMLLLNITNLKSN